MDPARCRRIRPVEDARDGRFRGCISGNLRHLVMGVNLSAIERQPDRTHEENRERKDGEHKRLAFLIGLVPHGNIPFPADAPGQYVITPLDVLDMVTVIGK